MKRTTTRGYLDLYLLAIIPIAVLLYFKYQPIFGIQIAFKDYHLLKGIWGSPWVGLKHFRELFASEQFFQVFANTLLINLYRFVFQFPIPILLAVMINEAGHRGFKRIVQTVTYLPHFLSWVVVSAMFINILSPQTGIVNQVIMSFGGKPIFFLTDERWFRSIVVISDAWKVSGWSSIIYLAAMQGIDPQLYEVAIVDGAGRFRRIWHITLPGIQSTIVFIVMLRLGNALADNMEQLLMLYNPMVFSVGDVLATFVYRIGLGQMKYSFTTAVGLFSSVIGFLLLLAANIISKRFGERGIF